MITVPIGNGIRAELHDGIFLDTESIPFGIPDGIEYRGTMYVFGRMNESGNPVYYLEN
ncbi:hypothetical protein FXW07_07150 [Methanosarcina sp. DH1]|uniref:hypothetical protein n=1 Tax=Methanosarcina sp. DH1 TaxID=2605695 RepID=UPI001E4311CB|nr:hypothetical protein [Methanosarcina sp. DH1]MCC4766396.1 hypothetical protein [Methanosarcina sp. DH1]